MMRAASPFCQEKNVTIVKNAVLSSSGGILHEQSQVLYLVVDKTQKKKYRILLSLTCALQQYLRINSV